MGWIRSIITACLYIAAFSPAAQAASYLQYEVQVGARIYLVQVVLHIGNYRSPQANLLVHGAQEWLLGRYAERGNLDPKGRDVSAMVAEFKTSESLFHDGSSLLVVSLADRLPDGSLRSRGISGLMRYATPSIRKPRMPHEVRLRSESERAVVESRMELVPDGLRSTLDFTDLRVTYRPQRVLSGALFEAKNLALAEGAIADEIVPLLHLFSERSGVSTRSAQLLQDPVDGQWTYLFPSHYEVETDVPRLVDELVGKWGWEISRVVPNPHISGNTTTILRITRKHYAEKVMAYMRSRLGGRKATVQLLSSSPEQDLYLASVQRQMFQYRKFLNDPAKRTNQRAEDFWVMDPQQMRIPSVRQKVLEALNHPQTEVRQAAASVLLHFREPDEDLDARLLEKMRSDDEANFGSYFEAFMGRARQSSGDRLSNAELEFVKILRERESSLVSQSRKFWATLHLINLTRQPLRGDSYAALVEHLRDTEKRKLDLHSLIWAVQYATGVGSEDVQSFATRILRTHPEYHDRPALFRWGFSEGPRSLRDCAEALNTVLPEQPPSN